MSKFKRSAKFVGGQIIRPYSEVFKSLKSLGGVTKQAVNAATKIETPKQPSDPDILSARNIKDAREKFEYLYKQKNWSKDELAQQLKVVKRTQCIFLVFALFSIVIGLFVSINTQNVFWSLGFFAIMIWTALFFCVAALKYAVFKVQLKERSLINLREFLARNTCVKEILLPF